MHKFFHHVGTVYLGEGSEAGLGSEIPDIHFKYPNPYRVIYNFGFGTLVGCHECARIYR